MRLNLAKPATLQTHEEPGNKQFSQDMMKFLRRDVRDFEELQWAFNDESDALAATNFNDTAS